MFTKAQEVNMNTNMELKKKLVRNSENSKSDGFKKFSVLAQILSFMQRIRVLTSPSLEIGTT